MKCQATLWHPSSSVSFSYSNNLCRSSTAARNMEVLSDTIVTGRDFRLENLWKASKKVFTVKSVTTSMWSACVVAHVKMQVYILLSFVLSLMCRVLVKSTPVTVNGGDSMTWILAKGENQKLYMVSPNNLLHVTQHRNSFLMYLRAEGI